VSYRHAAVTSLLLLSMACLTTPPVVTPPAPTTYTYPVTNAQAVGGCTYTWMPTAGAVQTHVAIPSGNTVSFTYTGPVPWGVQLGANCPGFQPGTLVATLTGANPPPAFVIPLGTVLPPPPPPLPAPPTLQSLLTAQNAGMQGETFQDPTNACGYGTSWPWWDPVITMLTPPCRAMAYALKHAAGDTQIIEPISWSYLEAGVVIPNAGADYTQNLSGFHALLLEAIQNGFTVDVRLAGDGESSTTSAPWSYNDPVGHTYGQNWLSATFPAIYATLSDLQPYIVWNPGFDGVWYGWQASEIQAFGAEVKGLCGTCALSIEPAGGLASLGNGAADYAAGGGLSQYDAIDIEFTPGQMSDDVNWQIADRLLCGQFARPPDMPATDDPDAPCYNVTAKVVVGFELDTYLWVRNAYTLAQILTDGAYLKAEGFSVLDIPIH
jgi:hypothetical protein